MTRSRRVRSRRVEPSAVEESERQLDLPLWPEIGGLDRETRYISVMSTMGGTGRVFLVPHHGRAEQVAEAHTAGVHTEPTRRSVFKHREFLRVFPNQTEIDVELKPLSALLGSAFQKAADERFEPGVISDFAKDIIAIVYNHGVRAVEEIGAVILSEAGNPLVSAEALRWLGQISHPRTYRERLWILQRSLRCSSPIVRDGAAIGLAWLDDPEAVPALQWAIDRETYIGLKEDMERVVCQLLHRE